MISSGFQRLKLSLTDFQNALLDELTRRLIERAAQPDVTNLAREWQLRIYRAAWRSLKMAECKALATYAVAATIGGPLPHPNRLIFEQSTRSQDDEFALVENIMKAKCDLVKNAIFNVH